MSGDVHVRFCEGAGVRFPCATRRNVYVRSRRAGDRVKTSITAFLKRRLKLKVNETKSAVDRPHRRKFLGFSFRDKQQQVCPSLAATTLARVKQRIRDLTSSSTSMPMPERIQRINSYLGGWVNYFALAETAWAFADLDRWLRHRMRHCLWKQWKRVKTRYRNLRALGFPPGLAIEIANTRKGSWRVSASPHLQRALSNAYWQSQGLISVLQRYNAIHASG